MQINHFIVCNHKGSALFATIILRDSYPYLSEIAQFPTILDAINYCKECMDTQKPASIQGTTLIDYLETEIEIYVDNCVGQYLKVRYPDLQDIWFYNVRALSTSNVTPKQLSQFFGSQSIDIDPQILRVIMSKDITQESMHNDIFLELLALIFLSYPTLSPAYTWFN